MKDESRPPARGGQHHNTNGTILNLGHIDARVIQEAQRIATARKSKTARLQALGLEPSEELTFAEMRGVILLDRALRQSRWAS